MALAVTLIVSSQRSEGFSSWFPIFSRRSLAGTPTHVLIRFSRQIRFRRANSPVKNLIRQVGIGPSSTPFLRIQVSNWSNKEAKSIYVSILHCSSYCKRSELLIHTTSVSEHRSRRSKVGVAYSSFWRALASSVHTCFKGGSQIMAWVAPRFGQSVTLGVICAGSGGHLNS